MNLTFRGILEVYDDRGKLIRKQQNQIHPENISFAVALQLGNKDSGPIKSMVFGSGGSVVNGVGNVTYLSKNIVGSTATLYSQTYEKIVDDSNISNADPLNNKMEVFHVDGNIFSDLVVTCTLELSEPNGQSFLDNTPNTEDDFVFDEIGLKSYDDKLISHVIFSPIQKSLNRRIVIKYTIRTQVC